jgi:hypothetical protein
MDFSFIRNWILNFFLNQTKTAQSKSETNELVTRKINSIKRQHTPPLQIRTQTHMNLRTSVTRDSLQFQHLNPPALSIQCSPIYSWYINNHKIHEDLQMNTVLSEIKKWNTKYLRQLENHTNELAVNLLDTSETTHRLKKIHLPIPTGQTWVKSQYKN